MDGASEPSCKAGATASNGSDKKGSFGSSMKTLALVLPLPLGRFQHLPRRPGTWAVLPSDRPVWVNTPIGCLPLSG